MRRDYRNVDLDTYQLLILIKFLENMIENGTIDSEDGIYNTKNIINKLNRQLEIAYKEF